MTKQERLDRLEELFETKLIKLLEEDNLDDINNLSTVGSWLAKNNRVAEKKQSDVVEDFKRKLEQAKKKRKEI